MDGTDALLPRGENVAAMVEPTDEEVDAAITGNMGHLVTVVSAADYQFVTHGLHCSLGADSVRYEQ